MLAKKPPRAKNCLISLLDIYGFSHNKELKLCEEFSFMDIYLSNNSYEN